MTIILSQLVRDTGFIGSEHIFENVDAIEYGEDEEGNYFAFISKTGKTTFHIINDDIIYGYTILEENHE